MGEYLESTAADGTVRRYAVMSFAEALEARAVRAEEDTDA